MLIGLDMGDTHTDAVLIEGGKVIRHRKSLTDREDPLETIRKALEELLSSCPAEEIQRINLSTTLCTNAVATGQVSPVGLLLEPGPGLNPGLFACGQKNFFLQGYVDHRGKSVFPPNRGEIEEADRELQRAGIKHLAIVGKFSPRNPEHELFIRQCLSPHYEFITLGHRVSGKLNFPRRIYTAYLNSAVYSTYSVFAQAMERFIEEKGWKGPVYVLKADGGTLSLSPSRSLPVETILSGPSASIMGALALTPVVDDALILDIGGTTTDVAFLAEGIPLLEPQGITLGGYPTLVRALLSYPLPIGGDSQIKIEGNRLLIGPLRLGPCRALGGPCPTPTDALIYLNRLELGDKAEAKKAIQELAHHLGLSPEKTATTILREMASFIAEKAWRLLEKINSRPVYTIKELLLPRILKPKKVIAIGGPAFYLQRELEEALGLPVEVPSLAPVANAIGAALSQPTAELTLLADTALGVLTVPEEGLKEKIPSSFTLEQAKERALSLLRQRLSRLAPQSQGAELEVVEAQSFNMVEGFYTIGRNIRVKVQVKPKITPLRGESNGKAI
ncbi:MAG TPA: hydantoinase/oxoprolinase family protein [Moorella mulderi]|nr:hydantoinase/oxoprolinase family protein [Moorella mulderi]